MTRPQFKHSKTIERWMRGLGSASNHRDVADVAWSTVMVCSFVPLDPFKVLSGRPELQVFAVLRAARPVVEVCPLVAAGGDRGGSVVRVHD
jgi:hypothetical protein